ncbi:MAG: (d)CMP kinase [Deltaproteobacteria bacterium]|nr:(d)CMP kinase [Deltaproteobacteria bacterium]
MLSGWTLSENGIMNQVITIDGPAGAGKSTVSRIVAKKLDYLYLDTGAMYRAVALQAKRMGLGFSDGEDLYRMCKELDLRFVSDEDSPMVFIGEENVSSAIRMPEMDMLASSISAVKEVREAMTELQRKIGRAGKLVAEGRDMGTVVFPDAVFKFFVTASVEVRVERRCSERMDRGESVSREDIEEDIRKRDEQDKTRAIAPLRPAEDAMIIDTSVLDIGEVVEDILQKIK